MSLFRGTYLIALDSKGRISIPSKVREILNIRYNGNLIITNFGQCLALYPLEEWENFEKKILQLPTMKKDVQRFSRYICSGAAEINIDKQGRVLLPNFLREELSSDKDLVMIGVLNRIEIWGKSKWDEVSANNKEDFGSISDTLAELGF